MTKDRLPYEKLVLFDTRPSLCSDVAIMLITYPSKAVNTGCTYGQTTMAHQDSPCNIIHRNFLINSVAFDAHLGNHDNQRLRSSSRSWKRHSQFTNSYLSKIPYRNALNRWLCRFRIYHSPNDEFRSSRNIAISLFRRYRNVIDRGGGDNLKEFISAGVNAYALGCTDEGLRNELIDLKESSIDIEGIKPYGGRKRVSSKILSNEVDECILWLSIVFITILCTPQPTVVRWSSSPPVSNEILLQWKGFCALIANAYYIKGMAWLPVKTLQLEQMAVVGSAEEPSLVASRMQIVFSTLEVVSPQWPRV